MPKKSTSISPTAGFSSLLVLAIIVVVLILAGVFIYNNQNQNPQSLAQTPSPTQVLQPSITPTPTLDISVTSLDRDEDAIDGKLSDLEADASDIDSPPTQPPGTASPTPSTTDKAVQELDKRILAATQLIERAKDSKKLPAPQKQVIQKNLQDTVTILKEQKKKLVAEGDAKELKIQQQIVISDAGFFGFTVPQVNTILNGDLVFEATDRILEYTQKLRLLLMAAKDAGNTITTVETRLTNVQSSLTEVQSETQKAIDSAMQISPTGYPDNKNKLFESRTLLRTERTDLKEAWRNAKAVRASLKTFKVKASPTP